MVCASADFCVSPGLGDLRAVNFQSSQSNEKKKFIQNNLLLFQRKMQNNSLFCFAVLTKGSWEANWWCRTCKNQRDQKILLPKQPPVKWCYWGYFQESDYNFDCRFVSKLINQFKANPVYKPVMQRCSKMKRTQVIPLVLRTSKFPQSNNFNSVLSGINFFIPLCQKLYYPSICLSERFPLGPYTTGSSILNLPITSCYQESQFSAKVSCDFWQCFTVN